MIFKKGQLVAILGCSQALETKYLDPINAACAKFNITTKLQLAAFIAQVGHESGRLATTVENLSYSADGLVKTWPSRFTAATAPSYARNQEKIANKVYADRMGNSSESSGDGWKYRGRGLIQVTGKSNYDAYSQASGFNAVGSPDALAEATHAAMSAGWFWNSKGLNAYADRSDFTSITKRINGGTNGQADRELLYKKALIVLSDGTPPKDDVVDKAPLPAPPAGAPTSPVSDQKTPGAQNSSITEPRAALNGESKSKYPWNFVNASRSGHITEVDDTPGYERLNMTHRTGTYWEMDNTGTLTLKSILDFYQISKYDMYSYVGGNYTQQIKGQSYVQVGGDSVTKVAGTLYANASKIQFNTGMLSVSGEINAPNINSTIFGPMGGMAFGDLLAKEALVAYDIKKGKAPMLGQSLGFKSAPGATEAGSADGLMPNKLDKQAPNGTPWITNGVNTAAGVVTVAAMAAGIADLFKKDTPSKELENAMKSAAGDIDKAASQASKETPVFVKHVSFAEPTLISQSTVLDKPDPSLYVNNLHTIVSSTGKGRLHMSNGVDWIPVGDAAAADHDYTDGQIAIVIDKINQNEVSTTNKILAEAQERAAAILNEATQRQQALVDEARTRQQQITSGLLAEATQRQADVRAEAIIRQGRDESLANRILELTASSSAEISAAIAEERQARTTAIEAEAFLRTQLAAKVSQNTASITDEAVTRSNETSALSSRITNYIASNDASIASFKTQINTKVDDQGNALSARIDAQVAANAANAAAITSETTARVTADGALGTRIDTVSASTESNRVAIQTETTARTTADTALGTRLDTLTASVTGMRTGINVLSNAGFMVGDFSDVALPLNWSLDSVSTDGTVLSMNKNLLNGGPDGYNFERITATPSKTSSQIRFGLKSSQYSTASIRLNTDYIFAVRARTSQDVSVGKLLDITPSNYPFNFVALTDMVLTKEWKWFVVTCKWTVASQGARDFYITYGVGNASPSGIAQSIDVATPMVAEGTTFLGFNLGNDATILINTAAITKEQTVRAAADSALSTRVDTVSSQTTNAQSTANAAATAANSAASAAVLAASAADAAQTSATAANTELANIASDNILAKGEKSTVLLNWQTIDAELANIRSQADAFGVSRTAYDTSYQDLQTYLVGIGPGDNGWYDSSVNSPIVGTAFRSKWANYYTARTNILNAITTRAKALADQGAATNAASIVNEATARTNGDQANATAIQTVSTTVAGHTSTISQQQTSIQGVQANYGIKINNNGYVSGFGLLSEPVNGNIVSAFNILADKFAIQAPNLNGGTPVVPFKVDATTTPPTISLNGLIRIGGSSDGTGGKNLIKNSAPYNTSSYAVGYNQTGINPTISMSYNYRPLGLDGGGIYMEFGTTIPRNYVCDLTNSNDLKYYAVIPGVKYEASAYVSVYRCSAEMLVVWLDISGNYVGEMGGNQLVHTSVTENRPLSEYSRTVAIGVAPPGAVKCYVGVRQRFYGNDYGQYWPYVFSSMWYFGQAGTNQTTASPWSPSGVTSISGGQIVTSNLSTISATIGVLETRASGARVQIRDDIIKVFNDSNIAKIKIGDLTK